MKNSKDCKFYGINELDSDEFEEGYKIVKDAFALLIPEQRENAYINLAVTLKLNLDKNGIYPCEKNGKICTRHKNTKKYDV